MQVSLSPQEVLGCHRLYVVERTWAEIFIASAPTTPLVQSRAEGDFPMTPRPMRVEMATEGDFPTTPQPMRVQIASDGDFLTPDKKDIVANSRRRRAISRSTLMAAESPTGRTILTRPFRNNAGNRLRTGI